MARCVKYDGDTEESGWFHNQARWEGYTQEHQYDVNEVSYRLQDGITTFSVRNSSNQTREKSLPIRTVKKGSLKSYYSAGQCGRTNEWERGGEEEARRKGRKKTQVAAVRLVIRSNLRRPLFTLTGALRSRQLLLRCAADGPIQLRSPVEEDRGS